MTEYELKVKFNKEFNSDPANNDLTFSGWLCMELEKQRNHPKDEEICPDCKGSDMSNKCGKCGMWF